MFGRRSHEPVEPPAAARPAPRVIESQVPSKKAAAPHSQHGAGDIFTPAVEGLRREIYQRIDPSVAAKLERDALERLIYKGVEEIAATQRIALAQSEQRKLVEALLDDMLGVGPIQPLLDDPEISDIMVNRYDQIYVERNGRLEQLALRFRDEQHLLNVARRIAGRIGRRVDEASPMVDARLEDGSRVNVVIPPLALDGTSLSIRKFSRQQVGLLDLAARGSMSEGMAKLLMLAGQMRLNIVISGGTGAGKTTLLNALSQGAESTERIVTIEDAAELKLQQPHVVRMETRPSNLEGASAIGQRELLRNALRMRPDRIILGEVRGAEAFEMLQAMNTGHDGSMSTLHANTSRDALVRLENMLLMGQQNLPSKALRQQISSAVQLVVQIARMRDGVRRIISIDEVTGMEQDTIQLQTLFHYTLRSQGSMESGLDGHYQCTGRLPLFFERARYYGCEAQLQQIFAAADPS
ncbi:MAG: CpaF family protein [Pseudomonadales bacterium]